MKRSPMPQRSAELRRVAPLAPGPPPTRTTELTSAVPIQRSGPPARYTPMPRTPSPQARQRADAWADVREEAWELAGRSCVLGGSPLTWERAVGHHRLMRSQGGPDTLANCLVLCPRCHLDVHRAGDLAYDLGWLIRMGGDPELVAVRLS